eukprot:TRINITY_DN32811_c0_g1_i1.p1 TRINITY_DN32811_c0_g1~~TRINITY_DN32811_c0_g1_i1.p1  ORF type:complete len:1073 (+),score=167.80 TRINITY_DN32811_c0_g1_i1:60-3278(+)
MALDTGIAAASAASGETDVGPTTATVPPPEVDVAVQGPECAVTKENGGDGVTVDSRDGSVVAPLAPGVVGDGDAEGAVPEATLSLADVVTELPSEAVAAATKAVAQSALAASASVGDVSSEIPAEPCGPASAEDAVSQPVAGIPACASASAPKENGGDDVAVEDRDVIVASPLATAGAAGHSAAEAKASEAAASSSADVGSAEVASEAAAGFNTAGASSAPETSAGAANIAPNKVEGITSAAAAPSDAGVAVSTPLVEDSVSQPVAGIPSTAAPMSGCASASQQHGSGLGLGVSEVDIEEEEDGVAAGDGAKDGGENGAEDAAKAMASVERSRSVRPVLDSVKDPQVEGSPPKRSRDNSECEPRYKRVRLSSWKDVKEGRAGLASSKPITLRHSGRSLRDGGLSIVLDKYGHGNDEDLPYSDIDLSKNGLTSRGLREVADICGRCPNLRVLKLFNNQIDDDGAEELERIFGRCSGIEELHLSHNLLTDRGVEAIVRAADRCLPSRGRRPLWLRVEHNRIERPEELGYELQKNLPSVCGREDRERCLPGVCARGRRIHVPFLIERAKNMHGRFGVGRRHSPTPRRRRSFDEVRERPYTGARRGDCDDWDNHRDRWNDRPRVRSYGSRGFPRRRRGSQSRSPPRPRRDTYQSSALRTRRRAGSAKSPPPRRREHALTSRRARDRGSLTPPRGVRRRSLSTVARNRRGRHRSPTDGPRSGRGRVQIRVGRNNGRDRGRGGRAREGGGQDRHGGRYAEHGRVANSRETRGRSRDHGGRRRTAAPSGQDTRSRSPVVRRQGSNTRAPAMQRGDGVCSRESSGGASGNGSGCGRDIGRDSHRDVIRGRVSSDGRDAGRESGDRDNIRVVICHDTVRSGTLPGVPSSAGSLAASSGARSGTAVVGGGGGGGGDGGHRGSGDKLGEGMRGGRGGMRSISAAVSPAIPVPRVGVPSTKCIPSVTGYSGCAASGTVGVGGGGGTDVAIGEPDSCEYSYEDEYTYEEEEEEISCDGEVSPALAPASASSQGEYFDNPPRRDASARNVTGAETSCIDRRVLNAAPRTPLGRRVSAAPRACRRRG